MAPLSFIPVVRILVLVWILVTKLAAEVLHCTQDVHVISGDTDHALFDKGAYASSGTASR